MKLMIIQDKAPLNSYLRTRDALASQISVVKYLGHLLQVEEGGSNL